MQLKRFFAVIPALALSTALVAAQEPQPQPTQQNPTSTQTDVGQPTDTNEPVYKGCVSGTKDNFVLTTSDGQSFRLHSDKDISEHVGKMVELRGTMKKEGADRPADAQPAASMQEIDVADLKNVEGSCPTSGASAMPQSDQTSEQASATEPAKTESSATDSAAAQPAASEPVASEPAVPASNENQPATETEPSAAASASTETQPAASANAEVKTETPAGDASANAAVSTDQSASASTSTDASANQATDQNATAAAGNEQNTESSSAQLPQTASPLPLLGLLGFASTGLGFLLRRK